MTAERLEKHVDRPRVSLAVLARSVPEGFRVLNLQPLPRWNAQTKRLERVVAIAYDGPEGRLRMYHEWLTGQPEDSQLNYALKIMRKALERVN